MQKIHRARLRNAVLGALFGAVALGMTADATPLWTTFGAPDSIGMFPLTITAHNLIAGYYYDSNGIKHGFLRTPDGTVTAFDAPGAANGTVVTGANTAGDITGSFLDYSVGNTSFVRKADGSFETFQYQSLPTYATAINARGAVIGYTFVGVTYRAILRRANGKYIALLPGVNAVPTAVNKDGVIAGLTIGSGQHVFVRAVTGDVTTFDVTGATAYAFVFINAGGEVAGTYVDASNNYHGFVREPDGTLTTFDATGAGTGQSQGTFAESIDDHGNIVGCVTDSASATHGFVREVSGAMHTIDMPGAPFTCVLAISAAGRLVGRQGAGGFVALPRVWQPR